MGAHCAFSIYYIITVCLPYPHPVSPSVATPPGGACGMPAIKGVECSTLNSSSLMSATSNLLPVKGVEVPAVLRLPESRTQLHKPYNRIPYLVHIIPYVSHDNTLPILLFCLPHKKYTSLRPVLMKGQKFTTTLEDPSQTLPGRSSMGPTL